MRKAVGLAVMLTLAALAAPAMGDEQRRTDLVIGGKAVDSFYMRSGAVEQLWVLNDQNVLMRNPQRDLYLISFAEGCSWIDRMENFQFVPALGGNMRAGKSYEARNRDERVCKVAGIREVASKAEADALVTN